MSKPETKVEGDSTEINVNALTRLTEPQGKFRKMSQETQESTSPCLKRTHYCGDLRLSDAGATAQLNGWVKRRRDHGGVIFVDLRDRTRHHTGLFFDPQIDEKAHALADAVRGEYVLNVSGTVRERDPGELLFEADATYRTELADGTLSPAFRALFSDVDPQIYALRRN